MCIRDSYIMEYEWNYPGKHYRVPNLTFLDNASYSLADIKIEALEGEDPNAKPAFHIENLAATADKEILSTSDSIRLTWNFVSTGAADAKEADVYKRQDLTLRTSLIAGFPSETEEEFSELLEFIKSTKFERLGVFAYSQEENTAAARLPEQMCIRARKRKVRN